jgi:hypothetical protein
MKYDTANPACAGFFFVPRTSYRILLDVLRCFNRFDRAGGCASAAIRAFFRVDAVFGVAFLDRLDGANRLTCTAGDAFIRDRVCHVFLLFKISGNIDVPYEGVNQNRMPDTRCW